MEKWRDIPTWEGFYQVSTCGRVKSLTRTSIIKTQFKEYQRQKLGQILSLRLGTTGYPMVTLSANNRRETQPIHKLVAVTFLNHIPCGHKEVVDHIDGNPKNNHISNLRLISNRENTSTKTSASGITGVKLVPSGRYQARAYKKGKVVYLGTYNSAQEAEKAYRDCIQN